MEIEAIHDLLSLIYRLRVRGDRILCWSALGIVIQLERHCRLRQWEVVTRLTGSNLFDVQAD